MKSIKPLWIKWTKIVQWSLIGFVVVYGVFWHDFAKDPMNPRPGEQPFVRIRAWMKGLTSGFWSHTSSDGSREGALQKLDSAEREGVARDRALAKESVAVTLDPVKVQARLRNEEIARDRAAGFYR